MKAKSLRGGARLLVLLGVTSLFVLLGATPATADPSDVLTLKLVSSSTEYGQGWSVEGTLSTPVPCNSSSVNCADYLIVTVDGSQHNLGQDHYDPTSATVYFGDYDLAPATVLDAGTHTINAKLVIGSTIEAQTAHPLTLTLTKTAVSVTTVIVPDPNNSANVIVTSKLAGDYIQQLPNCGCEDAGNYGLPAGTWSLVIKNSSGKTVLSRQQNQAANGFPVYVNYWQNLPPGESLTAESTFTVTGSSASSFTLSSEKFAWSSAASQRRGSSATSGKETNHQEAKPAAFEPPLFVYFAALLIAVILLALDILLLVRRRRIPTAPKGQES